MPQSTHGLANALVTARARSPRGGTRCAQALSAGQARHARPHGEIGPSAVPITQHRPQAVTVLFPAVVLTRPDAGVRKLLAEDEEVLAGIGSICGNALLGFDGLNTGPPQLG